MLRRLAGADETAGERRGVAETAEQLPRILKGLLVAHFAGDSTPLLDRMAPTCRTISESGKAFDSAGEVRRALEKRREVPAMTMREAAFGILGENPASDSAAAAPDPNRTVAVAGDYLLCTDAGSPLLYAATQHATAVCRLADGRWQILHLHVSNESSETVDESTFPVAVSRTTYAYVRRILGAARHAGMLPTRLALGNGASTSYLDPASILYVQAHGKGCIVHAQSGAFPVNALLSKMESQLPGSFVRIHRSYAVNVAAIREVRRFSMTLSDGTELPIAERRYADVRREIELRTTDLGE